MPHGKGSPETKSKSRQNKGVIKGAKAKPAPELRYPQDLAHVSSRKAKPRWPTSRDGIKVRPD